MRIMKAFKMIRDYFWKVLCRQRRPVTTGNTSGTRGQPGGIQFDQTVPTRPGDSRGHLGDTPMTARNSPGTARNSPGDRPGTAQLSCEDIKNKRQLHNFSADDIFRRVRMEDNGLLKTLNNGQIMHVEAFAHDRPYQTRLIINHNAIIHLLDMEQYKPLVLCL